MPAQRGKRRDFQLRKMRVTRIELAYPAWEADVLPLNYTRLSAYNTSLYTDFPAVVKRKISPSGLCERSGQVIFVEY